MNKPYLNNNIYPRLNVTFSIFLKKGLKAFLFFGLILLNANVLHAQTSADKIIGVWYNKEKDSKIKIFKNPDNTYSGKIVWIGSSQKPTNTPLLDKNNPDPTKRNRKILGLVIIENLVFKNNMWVNGKIYAPKKGEYADCEFNLETPDKLKFTISKGWFSKSNIWTKV